MRFADTLPAALLGLSGLMVLAFLSFAPRAGEGPVGAVLPPWVPVEEGFARFAALSVPIVDIRWGGRLIVTVPDATAGGEATLAALRRAGFLALRAGPGTTCFSATDA